MVKKCMQGHTKKEAELTEAQTYARARACSEPSYFSRECDTGFRFRKKEKTFIWIIFVRE